jgi:hypothetical protein
MDVRPGKTCRSSRNPETISAQAEGHRRETGSISAQPCSHFRKPQIPRPDPCRIGENETVAFREAGRRSFGGTRSPPPGMHGFPEPRQPFSEVGQTLSRGLQASQEGRAGLGRRHAGFGERAGRTWERAGRTWEKAGRTWEKAGRTWEKAGRTWEKAGRTWEKAGRTWEKAGRRFRKVQAGCKRLKLLESTARQMRPNRTTGRPIVFAKNARRREAAS